MDGRTDNRWMTEPACLYYKLTYVLKGSGELKINAQDRSHKINAQNQSAYNKYSGPDHIL